MILPPRTFAPTFNLAPRPTSDRRAARLFRHACDPTPGATCRPSGRDKGGGVRRRRAPEASPPRVCRSRRARQVTTRIEIGYKRLLAFALDEAKDPLKAPGRMVRTPPTTQTPQTTNTEDPHPIPS